MRARGNLQGSLGCLAIVLLAAAPAAAQSVAELQSRFDVEANSVHKAKLLEKLGDAQFAEARRAEKEGDNNVVDATLEKYRDNVRAALEALKKQHPDAEKHSNGYRQLEMHLQKGIREAEEAMLAAPEPYKPPLQLVRADLVAMDEEMIKLLFPHRPAEQHSPALPSEKQP
ncbi:MAG TPA: hypothetical protein VH114_05065 [Candidatus Acidoferrum sp.]|jgi:hypothetical protein|nr:hypothetical protein [Candidatus Acidoferrum sp.]